MSTQDQTKPPARPRLREVHKVGDAPKNEHSMGAFDLLLLALVLAVVAVMMTALLSGALSQ